MQEVQTAGGGVVGPEDQHPSLQLVAAVAVGGEQRALARPHVRQLQTGHQHVVQQRQVADVTGVDDVDDSVTLIDDDA